MSSEVVLVKEVIKNIIELLKSSDESRWCDYFGYALFLLDDPSKQTAVLQTLYKLIARDKGFSNLSLYWEGKYLVESNYFFAELRSILQDLCQIHNAEENVL